MRMREHQRLSNMIDSCSRHCDSSFCLLGAALSLGILILHALIILPVPLRLLVAHIFNTSLSVCSAVRAIEKLSTLRVIPACLLDYRLAYVLASSGCSRACWAGLALMHCALSCGSAIDVAATAGVAERA